MNRQLIIDVISYTLCCERHKTIIVYGKTLTEVNALVRDIALKIPDYVGLKQRNQWIWTTHSHVDIRCVNERNLLKGLTFSYTIILESVNSTKAKYVQTALVPCGKVVLENNSL